MKGRGSLLYVSQQPEGSRRDDFNPGELRSDRNICALMRQALTACQLLSHNNHFAHRNGASCGEPLAVMLFCNNNPSATLQSARVVTWGLHKDNGIDHVGVMSPCDAQGGAFYNGLAFGCREVGGQLQWNVIHHGTLPANRDIPDPTLTRPCNV